MEWVCLDDEYPPEGKMVVGLDEFYPDIITTCKMYSEQMGIFNCASCEEMPLDWNVTHWIEIPEFIKEKDSQ